VWGFCFHLLYNLGVENMSINQSKIKWGSLALFLLINIFIWSKLLSLTSNTDLKVIFLDVGQGDAIFIEASNGNQVLIDGGPNDQVLRELSKVMSLSDRSIDAIIATHPDSDHIGGLVSVLQRFESTLYIESGSKSDTLVYRSLEKALDKEKIERIIAKKGMILDLGNGVYLNILFPDTDASRMDPNTASIISQIRYGETSFLLTGDSPASIEKYIASIFGGDLRSDVLKAGHHGSKTSTSEIFLGFASPLFSVISAGEGNRYGHPHKEVVNRLEEFGSEIISTSDSGSIIFISDGKTVKILNSKF
jgi:competence protein ComEC